MHTGIYRLLYSLFQALREAADHILYRGARLCRLRNAVFECHRFCGAALRAVLSGEHDLPGGGKKESFSGPVDHAQRCRGHSRDVPVQVAHRTERGDMGDTVRGGNVGGRGRHIVSAFQEGDA